ncbi:DUF421 domain-containing protein [Mucilaginibacter limnophilus]|uniref:DUF421 domain-containing protein n=1 Tax=Mucilaginibacter limnophilus TaxID=1932778 RepID=A0A437MRM8_9SPHI|nr:YetF domain-containing protein [Mucilaginibacter limnophilus]RVU00312.1 DUF421 domain-containing protein [Mucilaginibacter limnophilus]
MKPEEIKIGDWMRWLVGQVPGDFYIELFIRAVFIYLLLMIAMRVLGKRMSSQIGRNDMVAMVTLAATIGIPLQAPDRGLLPAVVITILVVWISRWIAKKAFYDQKFERFSQGNISVLVKNAVMDIPEMKRVRLTKERLVAELRFNGVKQLGQVKRLYMEANGKFTIIREEEPKPGLFIIPRLDHELYERFERSDSLLACENCGFTKEKPFEPEQTACPSCGYKIWTPAVMQDS